MKSRLFWMILTGLGLALILLVIVQTTSIFSSTQVLPNVQIEARLSETTATQDKSSELTTYAGLTPVFFRMISEYAGVEGKRKIRLNGAGEANAVLTLLNRNERLRQIRADAKGTWEVEIEIDHKNRQNTYVMNVTGQSLLTT